jgi:FkbM family methyltransferase
VRVIVLNDLVAIVAGRDGYFLINRKDVYIGRALEVYGEFSGAEAAFFKRLIKPGDNVVEIGANIGAHTIGLSKAAGSTGKVFAFEPQRACYALLQAQIALNQLTNVFAYNVALGSKRSRLWVPATRYAELGNFGGVALSNSQVAAGEPVDVTTFDERLANISCAFVKIDVEGMEEEVIRGGMKMIRKYKPMLYVENDRIEKSKSLVSVLLELGYRLWWHIPPLYNRDNFFAVKENIYGITASFNMICAHEHHDAMGGLVEIKSPDDPHPLAPWSRPPGSQPSENVRQ